MRYIKNQFQDRGSEELMETDGKVGNRDKKKELLPKSRRKGMKMGEGNGSLLLANGYEGVIT